MILRPVEPVDVSAFAEILNEVIVVGAQSAEHEPGLFCEAHGSVLWRL